MSKVETERSAISWPVYWRASCHGRVDGVCLIWSAPRFWPTVPP